MFDSRIHDYWDPPDSAASRSLIEELVTAGRAENQAAARRLTAIGDLFEMRRNQRGEEPHWAVDTWAAVGAEVAAALRISVGKAGSYMNYGLAMQRLPAVAAVFATGDIDMATYRTIVYRTELVTNDATMAQIDQMLAARTGHWPSMSQGALIREIDRIVRARDRDAVRRTREHVRDRDVTVWDRGDGTADLSGRLLGADAALLDERLDALAATACSSDPRTADQRRADALGALAAGSQRLMCRCQNPDCAAAGATVAPVVIHIVADQSTLDGRTDRPGYLLGADSLIDAELLRDLAVQAKTQPLLPADSPAEPRYQPSRALAEFVRARDLTCRAPGCDRHATDCDLDHTVPYADGGATHASNLKLLCRFHHLLKTFWGWKDRQLRDGSVIWTLPDGQTYITTPGSALLFPSLMAPTGELPPVPTRIDRTPDSRRTAKMPLRAGTRTSDRAHRIATERSHNRRLRQQASIAAQPGAAGNPAVDDEVPPF
jgi:hypothetical protein